MSNRQSDERQQSADSTDHKENSKQQTQDVAGGYQNASKDRRPRNPTNNLIIRLAFPLRILVRHKNVGAIIGHRGKIVQSLCNEFNVRIQIDNENIVNHHEKEITIHGHPYHITDACKRIMQLIQRDNNEEPGNLFILKVLILEGHIGRLIGSEGKVIKRIINDTDAIVVVSNNSVCNVNPERVVLIKGTLDSVSKAQWFVSEKLQRFYTDDIQLLPVGNPILPYYQEIPIIDPQRINDVATLFDSPSVTTPVLSETSSVAERPFCLNSKVFIPEKTVGFITGRNTIFIKLMEQVSGARIRLVKKDPAINDENSSDPYKRERRVSITGSIDAQRRAQYMLFEKIAQESLMRGFTFIRLVVEVEIEPWMVGLIIGRCGRTIKNVEFETGTQMRINKKPIPGSEKIRASVFMSGPFIGVQSAQDKIRNLIQSAKERGQYY